MRKGTGSRVTTICALLVAVLLATAVAANDDADRRVTQRAAAMFAAQAALERLGEMSGGRRMFDAGRARAARRNLIALSQDIPGLFRAERMDSRSRALPDIWLQWDRFSDRARQAERAARALDTGSLNRLRMGLPAVLNTCIDCHRDFRKPP